MLAETGPEAWDFFGSSDLIAAMTIAIQVRRQVVALGDPRLTQQVSKMVTDLDEELHRLALQTAAVADEAILTRLRLTQKRPETNRSKHLSDAIRSEPYLLGSVKVALIDELNSVRNPSGYGPYWSAQEYGSVAVGNRMTGRKLYGVFQGPDHHDAPRAVFRHDDAAPGAEFISGRDQDGAGKGVIHREDQPRHFLRDGADVAWNFYRGRVDEISASYAARAARLAAGVLVV